MCCEVFGYIFLCCKIRQQDIYKGIFRLGVSIGRSRNDYIYNNIVDIKRCVKFFYDICNIEDMVLDSIDRIKFGDYIKCIC